MEALQKYTNYIYGTREGVSLAGSAQLPQALHHDLVAVALEVLQLFTH